MNQQVLLEGGGHEEQENQPTSIGLGRCGEKEVL